MVKDEVKFHNPLEKHFSVLTRYHYYFFCIVFLSKLPVFWHIIGIIFLSPPMDHYCNETLNVNASADIRNYCPCENPEWDRSVFTEVVQSKFGLFCDRKWLISFGQSIVYVGTLIGSISFGLWSDKFGRLSACTWSCLLLGVSGCLVSLMPTVDAFLIIRCIEGIAAGGYLVASYVFIVEHCGFNNREVISALFHIPVNVSHMSIAGVSYWLRHCDDFQLAISVPVFLFVVIRWITFESPKWLMDKGHVDEAADVMEKICKFNKVPSESIKAELQAYYANQEKSSKTRMKFFEIFKHKRLVANLACMSANYFVCGMGYYGVSQYIGQMSGDIHTNVAISGAVLIPGTLIATVLLKILERRTFLMSTNFLSGIFMIIVIYIPDHLKMLRVCLACICNCFFFMSFITAFLFGVELFPTSVRSSTLGFMSLVARIGQIVAPPINSLPQFISGLIFGVTAISGGILCYYLPETKNTELPSSLEDSKTLRRKTNINQSEPSTSS